MSFITLLLMNTLVNTLNINDDSKVHTFALILHILACCFDLILIVLFLIGTI